MYAIEFEADVKDRLIKIPDSETFNFKHVKVVVMAESEVVSKAENSKKLTPFFDLAGNIDIDKTAIDSLREKSLI